MHQGFQPLIRPGFRIRVHRTVRNMEVLKELNSPDKKLQSCHGQLTLDVHCFQIDHRGWPEDGVYFLREAWAGPKISRVELGVVHPVAQDVLLISGRHCIEMVVGADREIPFQNLQFGDEPSQGQYVPEISYFCGQLQSGDIAPSDREEVIDTAKSEPSLEGLDLGHVLRMLQEVANILREMSVPLVKGTLKALFVKITRALGSDFCKVSHLTANPTDDSELISTQKITIKSQPLQRHPRIRGKQAQHHWESGAGHHLQFLQVHKNSKESAFQGWTSKVPAYFPNCVVALLHRGKYEISVDPQFGKFKTSESSVVERRQGLPWLSSSSAVLHSSVSWPLSTRRRRRWRRRGDKELVLLLLCLRQMVVVDRLWRWGFSRRQKGIATTATDNMRTCRGGCEEQSVFHEPFPWVSEIRMKSVRHGPLRWKQRARKMWDIVLLFTRKPSSGHPFQWNNDASRVNDIHIIWLTAYRVITKKSMVFYISNLTLTILGPSCTRTSQPKPTSHLLTHPDWIVSQALSAFGSERQCFAGGRHWLLPTWF